jgi:hypothetical protein
MFLTADVAALGPLRSSYPARSRRQHFALLFGGVFCLLALGLSWVPFVLPAATLNEWAFASLILLLMLGGYVVLLWLLVLPALRDWNLRVDVHEAGLVVRRGPQAEPIAWDDAEAVFQRIVTQGRSTSHQFRLRTRGGRTLVFNDHLVDVAHLGATIQEEIARRELPRALATCRKGGTVTFHTLQVSEQGLTVGAGKSLPWPEVDQVKLETNKLVGQVSVYRPGSWKAWVGVPAARVPNLAVLFGLLREFNVRVN